jgi:hypothetical protein
MSQATDSIPLTLDQLNALAVRLRDDYVDVRNPALARDLDTAADVASQQARQRFSLAELAASLPTGAHARNEILKLLGTDMLASAEPAFYAIFYDVPEKWDAPAFPRMAHIDIETLENAIEIVSADGEMGKIYRASNSVIVECRAIATSVSGTNLWAADMAEAQASEE